MIEVIGIGADGWDSLPPPERTLVTSAQRVFGSRRQLGLMPVRPEAARPWPTPLLPALPDLLADHDRETTVVLASGDPLVAGIGSTLVELFGPAAVRVHPHVSSVALATARMGWPAETLDVVRVLTTTADELRRYLAPGRRLVVLSRDADTPATIARLLAETGFGLSDVSVLSDLGTDQERRLDARADQWPGAAVAPLNLVCVCCRPAWISPLWSAAPGLPDEAYEHDGQLTKRDVRASALAHLAPVAGQLLWDIGAGAGSVGIEWMRASPRSRSIAVERDPVRAERIRSNAVRLGVPELEVVHGTAPTALSELPPPDAVFVGGGATAETVERGWTALAGGGRLVVHAVTAETERVVLDAQHRLGGRLTRLSVEQLEPIGSFSGWNPARAVVQWSVQKALRP